MAESTIKKEPVEREVLSISANAYSTYALALAAMETAFDTLTNTQKRNSYIVYSSNYQKLNIYSHEYKTFIMVTPATNGLALRSIELKNHQFILYKLTADNYTTTDQSANAQAENMTLYTTM